MIRNAMLSATLALAASGCATARYEPPTGGPLAHVTLSKAQLVKDQDAFFYFAKPDGKLAQLTTTGEFQYDVPFAVQAETPIVLGTDLVTRTLGATAFCDLGVTFTPKTGRSYRVTPKGYGETVCETNVVDAETGAPPADFRRVQSPR